MKGLNLKTIYMEPFTLKSNSYCENLRRVFEVNDLKVSSLKERFKYLSNTKNNVILLNWVEDKVAQRKWWKCFRKLFEVLRVIRLLKKQNCVLVWIRHNIEPHKLRQSSWLAKYFHHLIIRYICSSANLCIVHSEQYCKKHFNYHFLPHPLYLTKLPKVPVKYDGIMMGRIMPYKGITETLSIWPKQYSLLIAGKSGDRNYFNKIKQIIAKRKLNVEIDEGHIEESKLNSYLSASRFVIVSNLDKSMIASGVIVHALSAGKPVISTPSLFAREYAQKGYPVRIFKVKEQLQSALSDDYKKEKAFERFKSDHSDEKVFSTFSKLVVSIGN